MADVAQALSPQTLIASLPPSSHDSTPRPVHSQAAALVIDARSQPLIASCTAQEGDETPQFDDDDTPSAG